MGRSGVSSSGVSRALLEDAQWLPCKKAQVARGRVARAHLGSLVAPSMYEFVSDLLCTLLGCTVATMGHTTDEGQRRIGSSGVSCGPLQD